MIGIAVAVELAAVVAVEEACRRKSNWAGLTGVKVVGLGKTLGMCFGIAVVTEGLVRRGAHLEAAERNIGAVGGSNIVYSCDIAAYFTIYEIGRAHV